MSHRQARSGLVALAAALALCGGCADPVASDRAGAVASPSPSVAASSPAPRLVGVPPCPVSDPDVPVVQGGLPDLTLPCLTKGPSVRLAGLRGTSTIVNVWASWCAPCRDELGYLADLQARARGELLVLGIDLLDRPEAARAAIEDFGVNFASVEDAEGLIRGALNVQAPPVTFFVDAQGLITFTKVGQIRSQAELDALAREHLGVAAP